MKLLAKDFMFYIDSCFHYTHAGIFADQGVLRSLVAKHHIQGNIQYKLLDGQNWNPTWNRADHLRKIVRDGEICWVNAVNNKIQHIWHGAGSAKLWLKPYPSKGVQAAWDWVCETPFPDRN